MWNHSIFLKKLALHPIPLQKSLKSHRETWKKGFTPWFFWTSLDSMFDKTAVVSWWPIGQDFDHSRGWTAWSTPNHWLKIVENRNRQNQQRSIKLGWLKFNPQYPTRHCNLCIYIYVYNRIYNHVSIDITWSLYDIPMGQWGFRSYDLQSFVALLSPL